MSNDREERVRKALEDLSKVDPSLAAELAVNPDKTIREVTTGLEKVETAWGGPRSSGPAIWELVKAPFTGKLHGIEVERGLWPWGMILLRFVGAVVGPIFGLIQWLSFWNLSRSGSNARITDNGVEVFSKRKGHIATHEWSEIAELRRIFEPPLTFWELVLIGGEEVPLPLADLDVNEFRARGITVHEQHKFRSEYKHDG